MKDRIKSGGMKETRISFDGMREDKTRSKEIKEKKNVRKGQVKRREGKRKAGVITEKKDAKVLSGEDKNKKGDKKTNR